MPRKPSPYEKGGWYVTSYGGRQHQKLCPVADGKRRAEQLLARLIAGMPLETAVKTSGPAHAGVSLKAAAGAFLEQYEKNGQEGTLEWYAPKLKSLVAYFPGRTVGSMKPEDGVAYRAYLKNERRWKPGGVGPERRGVSASTVNQHLRACKALFNWCNKPSRRGELGVTMNPWEEISQLPEKPRERLMTQEEFGALLGNCEDGPTRGAADDMREQLLYLRLTTSRPQEMRHLRWDHIKWELHLAVLPPEVVKTRNSREVPLVDRVEEMLKARAARLRAMGFDLKGRYVFTVSGYHNGVRTAAAGDGQIDGQRLSQRFRRLVIRCVKKGLIEWEKDGERLVPYTTRHTACTDLFKKGHDQATVQHAMGHKTSAMTERYKHLSGSDVARKIRERDADPT